MQQLQNHHNNNPIASERKYKTKKQSQKYIECKFKKKLIEKI